MGFGSSRSAVRTGCLRGAVISPPEGRRSEQRHQPRLNPTRGTFTKTPPRRPISFVQENPLNRACLSSRSRRPAELSQLKMPKPPAIRTRVGGSLSSRPSKPQGRTPAAEPPCSAGFRPVPRRRTFTAPLHAASCRPRGRAPRRRTLRINFGRHIRHGRSVAPPS